MKRTVGAIGASALLLSGCSSGAAEVVDPSESALPTAVLAPERTTAANSDSKTSQRGHLIKAFGERAGTGCETSGGFPCEVEFTIGSPAPATQCSTSQYKPEFGSILAFPIRVETLPGVDTEQYTAMFTPDSFSAVLASGVTVSEITSPAAWVCAESNNSVPSQLSPASTYEGFMVLDVPMESTTLIFQPVVMGPGEGGWEWPL